MSEKDQRDTDAWSPPKTEQSATPPSPPRSGWTNPRILQMASFSFFGAIPFQIVFNTMPTWLASHGIKASEIGLLALATLPWSFKFVWSPLLDRFHPPFAGRRRGS